MKKVILTVDDEEHILELISYNLELNGYEVLKALTGEEALEILDQHQVDLVLLDRMLPGIDGIEVLKQIRGDKNKKDLPVILLTAKSEEFDKVVGLEIGADDYICKPFGIHELVARIKAVLRRTGDGSFTAEEGGEEDKDRICIGNLVINYTTPGRHRGRQGSRSLLKRIRAPRPAGLQPQPRLLPGHPPGENLGLRLHGRDPHHRRSHPKSSQKNRAGSRPSRACQDRERRSV